MSINKRNYYNQLADPNCTIPYYLYVIKHLTLPIIKIGRSKDPLNRLDRIVKDFGNSEIIHIFQNPFNRIYPLETYLHRQFNDYCKPQPSGCGRTEWFCESITSSIITLVQKYKEGRLKLEFETFFL